MSEPVYLDHHATTPCDRRVLDAMWPHFRERFGNPSSKTHAHGWRAADAVADARAAVARLLGAKAKEIVFTSGATEANNLALLGTARAAAGRGKHVVTSLAEHKAVLDPCAQLEAEGFAVTRVVPRPDGSIDEAAVADAVRDDTVLVSLMWANNEVGAISPLRAIAERCHAVGARFHCDATQGLAWLPLDVDDVGVDLLSLSGHKMFGPPGIGALYVRRRPRVDVTPVLTGGGQERGLRAGTLNVPGIVGLGHAAILVEQERESDARRVQVLRDRLWAELGQRVPGLHRNGPSQGGLPNNLNFSVDGVEAEALLLRVSSQVAASSGSACTSSALGPSHVLRAMGLSSERASAPEHSARPRAGHHRRRRRHRGHRLG